ncbi:MAG: toprim domain-containing protein [Candidatus Omnitrophota bacterium]
MDGNEIKERLNQHAERVCAYLLPAGKKDGAEWVCGDVTGTPGTSLRIHLSGAKVGYWADFQASDQFRGRNLLSLWMAVRKVQFVPAMKEAMEFLGMKEDRGWRRVGGERQKESQSSNLKLKRENTAEASPPAPAINLENEYVPLRKAGKVFKWLTETRKIPPAVLEGYKIGESRDGECVVFPSFTQDPPSPRGSGGAGWKLNSLKFRNITDKSKMFVLPKGAPKMLFGIQAIPPEQCDLFISEGEIDAMTLAAYGFPAVSVPFGAKWPGSDGNDPNTEWIKHDYEWLEKFVEVFLCLDADEPGQKATAALIPRIGRTRCRILDYPEGKKDANECLVSGMVEKDFWKFMNASRDLDPEELLKPSEIEKDIWFEFYPDLNDKARLGDPTPWPALKFTFNPSELTIWHGYSGNGKTILLNHVMLVFAALCGKSSCIASLEFPARKTFKNLCRQAMGRGHPASAEELHDVIRWMDNYFWLYAHIGETTVEDALYVFQYVAKKYGVQHFVLDSLMMLTEIGGEEYDKQKAVCLRLKQFATDYNVHMHLVAHSKKPDSKHDPDKYPPRKYDISGSGNISNVADNVICVWRNKEKEIALATASDLDRAGAREDAQAIRDKFSPKEDARFIIQKNRETGEEVWRRLWFDKGEEGSWQYFDEDTKAAGAERYWKK